jgi:hypothetical protein
MGSIITYDTHESQKSYMDILTLDENANHLKSMHNHREMSDLLGKISAIQEPMIKTSNTKNLNDFLQVYYNILDVQRKKNLLALAIPTDELERYNNFVIGKIKKLIIPITSEAHDNEPSKKQKKKKKDDPNVIHDDQMPDLEIKSFDIDELVIRELSTNTKIMQQNRESIIKDIKYLISLQIHRNIREIIGPLNTNDPATQEQNTRTNVIIQQQLDKIKEHITHFIRHIDLPNSVENTSSDVHLKAYFKFYSQLNNKIDDTQNTLYKNKDYGAHSLTEYIEFKSAIIDMLTK